jgi:hypothetical protein
VLGRSLRATMMGDVTTLEGIAVVNRMAVDHDEE